MAKKKKSTVKSKPSAATPHQIGSTLEFLKDDLPRTLFPMATNILLAQNGLPKLIAHLEECVDDSKKDVSFLPQQRAFAAKPESHLRRTVKLDPVAEYFLYDIVYKNRSLFRNPHQKDREHFGYRFKDGRQINSAESYRAFRGAIADYRKTYKYFISFDIASYFNGIYHHDLVDWFRDLGGTDTDVNSFSQLLLQINSGRSIDCLPQGLYPSKMVGNDFLRFVDNHYGIKSSKLIRFMDDFYLFSDSESDIEDDFILIQELLGNKGLSINPQKTNRNRSSHVGLQDDIDKMKQKLLRRRRLVLRSFYDDEEPDELVLDKPLSKKELDYVEKLLKSPAMEEEDVELVLAIMRNDTKSVETKLPEILTRFPNLAKNVHAFCKNVEDKETVAEAVVEALKSGSRHLEFQLFWFGQMLEDYLMNTTKAMEIIARLLESTSATTLSKARVLEIKDHRFGLNETREKILKSGQSDWSAWASATGSLCLKKGSRNHVLKYFGNSSRMNELVASIVGDID